TGGAWIMYFADAPTLVREFWSGEAPYVAYATVFVLTMTTFIFGGFMREQVCIYMCPWPRIQTAMMDENSLTVTYKDWRGEPRGSVKKAEKHPGEYGDCVDCGQCVAVCPTGWDIRKGPDISCINCALCIDACDRVMGEVDRPRGLIDYVTLKDADREAKGEPPRPVLKALLRPRSILYFCVWSGIGLGLLFALGVRSHTEITVAADRNPPYMLMSDGRVRNNYTVKVRNMEGRPRTFQLSLAGLDGALMWSERMDNAQAARDITLDVPADTTGSVRIYVMAPAGTTPQDFSLGVVAQDEEGEGDATAVRFATPEGE
ncbi:MAG: cytochrome c oxidase accessory protein CcoG, partial [Erythrobacter sp.]|nr:cytochrome c oxidase accessory protein CcoG [Erythrobacter sp.]